MKVARLGAEAGVCWEQVRTWGTGLGVGYYLFTSIPLRLEQHLAHRRDLACGCL